MTEEKSRSRALIAMRFWAILMPSLFFSYVTDTAHIVILCLLAGLVNFFQKSAFKVTLRTVIYGVVISLTITVLTNTIFKIERFYLTPSEIGVPAALIFAMVLTFFDDRPYFSASILVFCVFAMMMCGDINSPHRFQSLPLPAILGSRDVIHLVYIICLCLCVIPFFYLMNRSQNRLCFKGQLSYKLYIVKAVLVVTCLVTVFFLYRPTLGVMVPLTRNFESQVVRALSQWRLNKKKTAFEESVNLRDSYFNGYEDELGTILIRVEADKTPGYLRSRVYELYKGGVWSNNKKTTVMNLLQEDHEYSFNTYSFNGQEQVDKNSLEKIQVQYSGNFQVDNVVHQGKTRYVEMTCETLSQTDSGSVSGKALDFSGGVTLYNDKDWSPEDSFDGPVLTTIEGTNYLQTPGGSFVPKLKRVISHEIAPTTTDDPKLFAAEVKRFFNEKFSYALGVRLDQSQDPVFAFLQGSERKGHCELFATATVMMLRAQGIPARYVTGFYCQEKHPDGKYFVGRSKDLHAWVEFYDVLTQSWYLLEPTPASGVPHGASGFNFLSSTWDSMVKRWNDFMSNVIRGYFAESIILFLKGIMDMIVWCFNSFPKAMVCLTLLYLWYVKKYKRPKAAQVSQEIEDMQKDLRKLLGLISKVKGLKVEPSMTIREVAGRLEQMNEATLLPCSICLKEYESIRYNSALRSRESMKEVHAKIRKILKTGI